MEKEKLKSMPKVELHCHLDGSFSLIHQSGAR